MKIKVPPPPEGGWHVTLTTALPHCCSICGWPLELSKAQIEQFEHYQVAVCMNGGHLFQKVTIEAILLTADAVGSDLRDWLKATPEL